MSERIPFIVYRDVILGLSETFIASPAPVHRRYEPWFTGTTMQPHELLDPARVIDPELPGWRAALYKFGRIVPRSWVDRLSARRPQLLHAHFGTDGVFSAPLAKRLGIPQVVTFWGFDATIQSASPLWKAYEFQRRRLYRRADQILTVSDFIRRKLLEDGCPPDSVETHYTGVDTQLFQPGDEPREPFILFVGRLVEKKGCGDLIEAIRRAHERGEELRLRIVGDGPLRAQLEAQAAGLNVTFLGPRPPAEVRNLMQRASIFSMPSRSARSGDSEGLPFVVLEAQSSGLPVVSTLHAGIPEAILDGETGLLSEEGDVEQIAANLLLLSRNEALRQQMGEAGRARMCAHFDLRTQTVKLEAIYDRVRASAGLTRGLTSGEEIG